MLTTLRRCFSSRLPYLCTSTFGQDIMDLLAKEKEAAAVVKDAKKHSSRYDGRKKKRMWEGGTNRNEEPETKVERAEGFERIKRKKFAILLGYCGKNYYGMQRNPGMRTIEEELLSAMKAESWISEEGYTAPQQAGYQRAARTDKGVSAARQCVSVKIPNDVDVVALNSILPADIRVFAVKRVTKGFNSKDQCDARTYMYTLPTVSFTSHDQLANVSYEGYRTEPSQLEKVSEVLKLYEGTKCFHNFTAKKGVNDPSARRVILSFTCGEPFILKDVEFVTLKVKGQSFMLHQIRKMVGLALAIIRGLADKSTIELATSKILMDIPTAPGLGLMLDQVHYDRYSRRYSGDGYHDALEWTDVEPVIEAFIREKIFPEILQTELTEKPMLGWLDYLKCHTYLERKPEDAKLVDPDEEKELEDAPEAPAITVEDSNTTTNVLV